MYNMRREPCDWMMKRIVIFAAFCGLIKLILAALPESAILASFCRVPAEVAAFYYGVPLEVEALSFTAKGVTLAVTRACAATDFFALVAAVLLTAQILREGWRWQQLVQLPIAWAITLAVNSLRIVALVPVDAVFPKDHAPVVHLLAGVAFFLPAFAGVWWYSFNRVSYGNHKERKETQSS